MISTMPTASASLISPMKECGTQGRRACKRENLAELGHNLSSFQTRRVQDLKQVSPEYLPTRFGNTWKVRRKM